jgi:hypothetical protein
MVRLEKIDLHLKSWWAPTGSDPVDPGRIIGEVKTADRQCPVCDERSKIIYTAGFACLNTACKAFYDFGKEVEDSDLDYNKSFLSERTSYLGNGPRPLQPPLLTDEDLDRDGRFGVESVCAKGIVCPNCKGCSRRIDWKEWRCENGCGFTHSARQKIVSITQAISPSFDTEEKEQHNVDFGIRFGQTTMGLYDVFEYTIPGLDGESVGVIRHFKSIGIINAQPDGPNDLFRMMQEEDFGLKRNPARQSGCMLTHA